MGDLARTSNEPPPCARSGFTGEASMKFQVTVSVSAGALIDIEADSLAEAQDLAEGLLYKKCDPGDLTGPLSIDSVDNIEEVPS